MPFTTEKLPRQTSCKLFEGVLISESLERHRYDVNSLGRKFEKSTFDFIPLASRDIIMSQGRVFHTNTKY